MALVARSSTALAPLAIALVLAALLLGAVARATPVRAGAGCALQATVGGGSATEVETGEEVLIEGFEFPAGGVEVSFSSDGTFLRSVTVTADASGLFETTVVPAVGEGGTWSVEAVPATESCTATTGFLVLAGAAASSASPGASTIPDVAVPVSSSAAPSIGLLTVLGGMLLEAAAAARLAVLRRRH